jgi:transcriptional regulator with GAF, ATPase, and Fis domain
MAGVKGSLHKDWENQKHIMECIQAYHDFGGNCKKAARHLMMTHQHLHWIWKRAGMKPKGTSWAPINENLELKAKVIEHGNISRAARELGMSRNRANRIIKKFNYK